MQKLIFASTIIMVPEYNTRREDFGQLKADGKKIASVKQEIEAKNQQAPHINTSAGIQRIYTGKFVTLARDSGAATTQKTGGTEKPDE